MSLITFVVVGKDNNPLYLRDFVETQSSFYTRQEEFGGDDRDDPFGFFEHKRNLSESSSLKNQVC